MNAGHEMEKERRPTAARKMRVLERMAQALVRRGVSPNVVSMCGMVCGVFAGLCFASTRFEETPARLAWLLGVTLLGLRIAANLLDGMVAMASGRPNPTGPLWNEVPDRISDAALLVGLGLAAHGDVVLGLTAAWVSTMVAYLRIQARSVGAPQDYGGPMAKPQRAALVAVTGVYLGLAPEAWRPAIGLPVLVLAVVTAGGALTCVLRLRRAATRLREAVS